MKSGEVDLPAPHHLFLDSDVLLECAMRCRFDPCTRQHCSSTPVAATCHVVKAFDTPCAVASQANVLYATSTQASAVWPGDQTSSSQSALLPSSLGRRGPR